MLPEPGTLPDDQNTTVSATWSLSIERADNLNPAGLARPTLQLAAMLDPNGIPQSVLTSEPARTYLAHHHHLPRQRRQRVRVPQRPLQHGGFHEPQVPEVVGVPGSAVPSG